MSIRNISASNITSKTISSKRISSKNIASKTLRSKDYTTNDVAFAQINSPGSQIYKFNYNTGWGTKYANPSTSAGRPAFGSSWHPSNNYYSTSTDQTPVIYNWNTNTGYGTRLALPTPSWSAWGRYVQFSRDGNKISQAAYRLSPFVRIWNFPALTSWANPATLPSGGGFQVLFNSTSDRVIAGSEISPWINAWTITSSAWGTKFANPSNLSVAGGGFIRIHPDDTAVARICATSPFLIAYSWSNSTGFGTLYANPSTLLPAGTGSFTWNIDGTAIIAPTGTIIHAYAWSNSTGFGTKYSNPSSTTLSTFNTSIATTGNAIIYANNSTSPFIQAIQWDNSTGFGTIYANPSTLPAAPGAIEGVASKLTF